MPNILLALTEWWEGLIFIGPLLTVICDCVKKEKGIKQTMKPDKHANESPWIPSVS